MDATLALAALVAVAAAVRSTWSPCGVSMLSTITPVTEASRARSYPVTVSWFVAGAVLGGATLGLGTMALATLVGGLDLPAGTTLGTVAALALLAGAFDARVAGLDLPGHGRQVNETWLTRFRSWVYGGGFGWQIGVGLATYIVTAGVYLTVATAALTGRPLVAAALGTLFGLTRGLAIFAGARLTTHEALAAFHRRFEERRELSRRLMIGLQLAVGVVAAGLAWGPSGLAAAVAAGVAVLGLLQPEVMRVRSSSRGVTTRVELTEHPHAPGVDERLAGLTAGS